MVYPSLPAAVTLTSRVGRNLDLFATMWLIRAGIHQMRHPSHPYRSWPLIRRVRIYCAFYRQLRFHIVYTCNEMYRFPGSFSPVRYVGIQKSRLSAWGRCFSLGKQEDPSCRRGLELGRAHSKSYLINEPSALCLILRCGAWLHCRPWSRTREVAIAQSNQYPNMEATKCGLFHSGSTGYDCP